MTVTWNLPPRVIYLIGSLKNDNIPVVAARLREALKCEVFEDWIAAGPEADEYWQKYEQGRGHTFAEALRGWTANHVFSFDKRHLDRCTEGVLVLPAGKSGHLELGYLAGKGKPTYILMDKEPEKWDQMYQFATAVVMSTEALIEVLK